MPKFSFLVPVYNAEQYLSKCLDSILQQPYKNIEVLCVNDGSTDNSHIILERYKSLDKRIKVFNQDNQGASAARNLALKNAKGNYICMLDADDFLENKSLSNIVTIFEDRKIDCVLFDLHFYWNDRTFHSYDRNAVKRKPLSGKEALKLSLDWEIHGVGCYRREIFDNINYDVRNIHGDELTTRQLFLKSNYIAFSDLKYYYRQHELSTTLKFSLKRFDILDNQFLIRDFLVENNVYEFCKVRFTKEFIKTIWIAEILLKEHSSLIDSTQKNLIREKLIESRKLIDYDNYVSSVCSSNFINAMILIVTPSSITCSIFSNLFVFFKKLKIYLGKYNG